MRPEAQCRHRAWCWEVVGFHNTRGFTVAPEHRLEQKNHEVLFGIFISNEEKDSLALQRRESHIWTAGAVFILKNFSVAFGRSCSTVYAKQLQ